MAKVVSFSMRRKPLMIDVDLAIAVRFHIQCARFSFHVCQHGTRWPYLIDEAKRWPLY